MKYTLLVFIIHLFFLGCQSESNKSEVDLIKRINFLQDSVENNYIHIKFKNGDLVYNQAISILEKNEKEEGDYEKAHLLLDSAANLGNLLALEYIGCHYLKEPKVLNEFGVNEDQLVYLFKAISLKSTRALNCLSKIYYGKGIITEYLNVLYKSDSLGDIYAPLEIGYFSLFGSTYHYGQMGQQDYDEYIDKQKGFDFIAKACTRNNYVAIFKMGELHFNGIDSFLKPNKLKAKEYFVRCKTGGYMDEMLDEYLLKCPR